MINLKNKKAQEATTLTWIVATFIILFVLIAYSVFAATMYYFGEKPNIETEKSLSSEFLKQKQFLISLEKTNYIDGKYISNYDLLKQVGSYFLVNDESYIDMSYFSTDKPFINLDEFSKTRLGFLRPDLVGYMSLYRECHPDFYCFPILVMQVGDKDLINFQPANPSEDASKTNIIYVPLYNDNLAEVKVSESLPIGKAIYDRDRAARDSPTGNYPVIK